jgi:hypothetical protein
MTRLRAPGRRPKPFTWTDIAEGARFEHATKLPNIDSGDEFEGGRVLISFIPYLGSLSGLVVSTCAAIAQF